MGVRILVVGAGSIGGYFGGRLLDAGRDVTFLVRARRAAQLAQTGLVIRSPLGDLDLPAPPTITAEALREPYDLILLSVKAYDLDGAMDAFAPAVGPHTLILPLLNGMRHLDLLDLRFGAERALGGQCVISTVLDPDGRIVQLGEMQSLSFGARDGSRSEQIEAVASALSGAGFEARLSEAILQEMWEKWVFIATVAGITCLMRASIGDIVAAGAGDLATTLLDECAAIAAGQSFAPSAASMQRIRSTSTAPGSGLTASMLRDIERGVPIEADQIVGDLLRRGEGQGGASPLLRVAYAHLKSYEARRARTAPMATIWVSLPWPYGNGSPDSKEKGPTAMSQTTRQTTQLTIEHVVVAASQPYDQVVAALEARLGPVQDWAVTMQPLIAAKASWEQVEQAIAAQIGTSGLALFYKVDHSLLLALAGKTSRASQYTIGNPLLAVQMTRHMPEAALYAPLRIVVYENEAGNTFVAYDRFVSFIAQYQREEMTQVAQVVEHELEALIAAVTLGDAHV